MRFTLRLGAVALGNIGLEVQSVLELPYDCPGPIQGVPTLSAPIAAIQINFHNVKIPNPKPPKP